MTKIPRTSGFRAKILTRAETYLLALLKEMGQSTITHYGFFQVSSKDSLRTYLNRGIAKMNLGFTVKATSDLETALELARNSNNVDLVSQVK